MKHRWTSAFISLMTLVFVTAVGFVQPASAAPPPFFTPATHSGSVNVQLNPTSAVSTGTSKLVTFGVPFPRGSLTEAQLSTLKVVKDGAEIPAHVDQMTPWRHATDASIDGASVRVARVQIHYTFTSLQPVNITVQYGGSNRTQNVAQLEDARSAWHKVTDGTTSTGGPTYGAAQNVFEPDVYAVLPKAWLTTSGIKTPMTPLNDAVGPNRLNPNQVGTSYPGFRESDQAQLDFFYTIINDDDPLADPSSTTTKNTNGFLTSDEPWLYDRGSVMHLGYLKSGYLRFLREAVRNTEFYRTQLWTPADCNNGRCVGSFKPKNPDAAASWHDQKYSYNESLALTYWLTGDTKVLSHIEDVVKVFDDVSNSPNLSFWTERHIGLKLTAYTVAYEVTGKPEYRDGMQAIITALRQAQLNPIDNGPVDGGIWHDLQAHEGDNDHTPIASPWMSPLIADAMTRAYLVSESPTAEQFLVALAGFECGVGSYMTSIRDGYNPLADQSGGVHQRLPHYLATRDGLGYTKEFNPDENMDHANEVGSVVAWGAYFADKGGDTTKANNLKACAGQLYKTFSHVITYWTRPAAPPLNADAYRIDPNRKYTWWFKNSTGFEWAMNGYTLPTDPDPNNPPPPPPGCGVATSSTAYNKTFTAQTGSFGVTVDATPGSVNDTGVGIGSSPPINETNQFSTATTIRFNHENNHIEARSGAAYPATTITYTAGTKYRLRMAVNVTAHTYSAFVTAPGGSEQTIGTNLSFRSNYGSATSLNNLRGASDGGNLEVCPVTLP